MNEKLERMFYHFLSADRLADFLSWLHRSGNLWEELQGYSRDEWKAEIAKGATQLGYWEWAFQCEYSYMYPDDGV